MTPEQDWKPEIESSSEQLIERLRIVYSMLQNTIPIEALAQMTEPELLDFYHGERRRLGLDVDPDFMESLHE